MKQIAPGRYEADFELNGFGSFVLRAEHARRDADGNRKPFATSTGRVSNPYPREYASFEPDVEKLTRAASVGGGTIDPNPSAVFDPGGEKITLPEGSLEPLRARRDRRVLARPPGAPGADLRPQGRFRASRALVLLRQSLARADDDRLAEKPTLLANLSPEIAAAKV